MKKKKGKGTAATDFELELAEAITGGESQGGTGYDLNSKVPWQQKTSYPYGVNSSTTSKQKLVVIVNDKGEEIFASGLGKYSEWWNFAKEVYPPDANEEMKIPASRVTFGYKTPPFNPCVYTAADDYVQARWGRRLHGSDKEWLALHPLSTDGGVPVGAMMTCIQQLVEPYGLGISRVRIRKGMLAEGPEYDNWKQTLGCNPLGYFDHETSNEAAATQLGVDLASVAGLWRLEFHEQPLPCSIIGEKGWTNSTGVQTGAFGGHARYLAPRAYAGDWQISIQLAPVNEIPPYLVPPALPEYVARKGDPELRLTSIMGPDGKPFCKLVGQFFRALDWVDPATKPTGVQGVGTTTVPFVEPKEPKALPPGGSQSTEHGADTIEFYECKLCKDGTAVDDMAFEVYDAEVCRTCYSKIWENLECPHCKQSLSSEEGCPEYVGFDGKKWFFQCPHRDCLHELWLRDDTDDKDVSELLDLMWAAGLGCFTDDVEYEEEEEDLDVFKVGDIVVLSDRLCSLFGWGPTGGIVQALNTEDPASLKYGIAVNEGPLLWFDGSDLELVLPGGEAAEAEIETARSE